MLREEFKFATLETALEHDDIVVFDFGNLFEVNLPIAKEIVSYRHEFTQGKPHYVIFETSGIKVVSVEAKKYLQTENSALKNILAAAFVASNPVSALIANIFIRTPTDFKSRFFPSRYDALTWLKGLKESKKLNVK